MKVLMQLFKIIIIPLFILYPYFVYGQCDIKLMKDQVINKITQDLIDQDSSKILIDLTAGVDTKKYRGDKYCDTIEFYFMQGAYLRFYLLCTGVLPGDVNLRLLRVYENDTIYKTINNIENSTNKEKIESFDYFTAGIDKYYLILSLKRTSSGCAFATFTQFFPKKGIIRK